MRAEAGEGRLLRAVRDDGGSGAGRDRGGGPADAGEGVRGELREDVG